MRPILRILAFWATVLSLAGLTTCSYFATRECEDDRELLRIGLEDAAGRVRAMADNLKLVREYNDAAMLAKARAFARIVNENPSVLTNLQQLTAMTKLLDVDEVHVSTEKGVLFACVPPSRAGLDMAQLSDQTRAFLPALSDKSFELAQEPFSARELFRKDIKGLFQFAGVARIDKPGIVQVGQRARRVEQALKLADVSDIERTTRIGRYGRASIGLSEGLPPPAEGVIDGTDPHGRKIMALESDAADFRVRVWMPNRHPRLSRPMVFKGLLTLDALLLVLWIGLFRKLRRLFALDLQALRTLFEGSVAGGYLHTLRSPVALTCVAAFSVAILICWAVSARSARRSCEEIMLSAAKDMHDTFDSCVDLLLFYQGDAICRHFKSPENMSTETVNELMHRYGLDELNVVNAHGKILIGALADVGYDMGSKPQTAEFNCLLNGVQTFSQAFRGAVENPTLRRKYAGIAFPPPAKGYIQIGFAEERLKDDIDYWFAAQAIDWHIGETGFYVIAKDETGDIDSCGFQDTDGQGGWKKGDTLAGIGFDATRAPKSPDSFFVTNLFGVDCLCLTEVKAFHRIITAMPLAEVRGNSTRITLVTALVLLSVLVLVVVFMTRLSELVSRLKGFIAAEKDRQVKDLALAKTIQASALPFVFPNESDFGIFASMTPAREVGGDFYDFFVRPDGKLVFLVADVSGKGVPAALFMMRAKSIIRAAVAERPDSISSAIAIANGNLAEHNEAEMFVTAWVGVYDRATGEIAYVNAGHNPPLVKRADGAVEWLRSRSGLVLAAMGGVKFRSGRCRLEPGDSIFLYTDGVTEAMNAVHELYGEARLEATLKRASRQFVTEVGEDVAVFAAGAEQSDDITMLALDRRAERNML